MMPKGNPGKERRKLRLALIREKKHNTNDRSNGNLPPSLNKEKTLIGTQHNGLIPSSTSASPITPSLTGAMDAHVSIHPTIDGVIGTDGIHCPPSNVADDSGSHARIIQAKERRRQRIELIRIKKLNINNRPHDPSLTKKKRLLNNQRIGCASTSSSASPVTTSCPAAEGSSSNTQSNLICEAYFKAESQGTLDFGDATYVCKSCNATVWYEERSDKSNNSNNPEFAICCMKGKVQLPTLTKPPTLLYNLIHGIDPRSKLFMDNIRAYNSMFSFTSLGGKIDNSTKDGHGPPNFILSGQNFHRIGDMLPLEGDHPMFAQLYIYDTQNETANRMRHFRTPDGKDTLDETIVEDFIKMLDDHNQLAKSFRRAHDFAAQNPTTKFSMRLFRGRTKDPRIYNLPTTDEVAALIVGDLSNLEHGRDVIVQDIHGGFTRVHETHTSFLPLQYPLLFPYGEDGFQEHILMRDSFTASGKSKRVRISLREFIAFRLQDRQNEYGNIVLSGRLFQQFCVDCYTMIEAQRLSFIRNNQKIIRSDLLNGLEESLQRGDTEPSSAGMRVVLPASYTGGARYMFNNCQDAMAICKRFGYPDLFITITCNTNWDEIKNFVSARGQSADERPDIICRVFKIKFDQLMIDLKKNQVFGKVDAGMYTIEFQKRGLPHGHILLWLSGEDKLKTSEDIDKIISAEIPHPELYPKLSSIVMSCMIHGPCGEVNKYSPCMKEKKCSKYYPKKFLNRTIIDEDGYPRYKRRDTGIKIMKKDLQVDNTNVVPYNPFLLMRYRAHINVEYCNKSNAIKYLFKYVNKGPDRVTVELRMDASSTTTNEVRDEIKHYYDCRYLSPCEAIWRTFCFDIHHHWPPVQKLNFHLPNCQNVFFKDHEEIADVVGRNKNLDTMFTSWFRANIEHEEGRDLTYAEFPTRFVYSQADRMWYPRKQGFAIGRLNYTPPSCGETYYLRILLTVKKGCISYESIRTVDGVLHETYQGACYALGLLADDKEYIEAIKEANEWASGHQLRRLFVNMLLMNTISKPDVVWASTWQILCDGILHEKRTHLRIPDLQIGATELKNLCLIEVEKLLQKNSRTLRDFGSLPYPDITSLSSFENNFIVDELNYNKEEMSQKHLKLLNSLTMEQRGVYNQIMHSVQYAKGGFYFLYGYGGTGKTFIWNTLSAALRSQGKIVLNVASSGIASLLLPGGRTAHSRFSIPISIHELSSCNIKQGSLRANLLRETSLIIWDEAPMLNRFCFEALDRTLRDLMSTDNYNNSDLPFGGKVVILGGDFRQILPVIQKGSRQDIVKAAINSSDLWHHCTVLKLTKNMRLNAATITNESNDISIFAEWILNIGNGSRDANQYGEYDIQIPSDLLINQSQDPLLDLVNFTYPDLCTRMIDYSYFEDRAILSPTLQSVEMVNDYILSSIPGEEKQYLSSDTSCISDKDSEIRGEWFTTEFLNEIKSSGLPCHRLNLKVGVPVMLLRNINQSAGLCNGTRVIITELGKNVIGAKVITGTNIGDKIYIPRMTLVPSDSGFPFKFQRRQFPVSLCFAMTINKSQGQSLSNVGLYLPNPVFTHGQLYVAVSRVRSRQGLKILILDEEGNVSATTKNVVYNEVFENL